MLDRAKLFPHLTTSPAEPVISIQVGHGLVARLGVEDSPVSPSQLQEAGLTGDEAFRIALENLARFADDSPDLSIQVLGGPEQTLHVLLYSDHPLASSCLLLPDLHDHAREVLQTDELCACVPQMESLVIFARRDRDKVIAKLREIEANAEQPLTFGVFELNPGGPAAI